MLLKIILF